MFQQRQKVKEHQTKYTPGCLQSRTKGERSSPKPFVLWLHPQRLLFLHPLRLQNRVDWVSCGPFSERWVSQETGQPNDITGLYRKPQSKRKDFCKDFPAHSHLFIYFFSRTFLVLSEIKTIPNPRSSWIKTWNPETTFTSSYSNKSPHYNSFTKYAIGGEIFSVLSVYFLSLT